MQICDLEKLSVASGKEVDWRGFKGSGEATEKSSENEMPEWVADQLWGLGWPGISQENQPWGGGPGERRRWRGPARNCLKLSEGLQTPGSDHALGS